MKKRIKIFITSLAVLNAIYLINTFIFEKSEKKKNAKIKHYNYESKHGKINYITKGEGSPILLIHCMGIGASYFEWKNNIDFLSKRYKVYAIDLIGFGNSDKPKISYSAYLYVQLINEFISNVIKSPANVIANSNSAALTVMAYTFDKSLYKKLLLISPTGLNNEQPSNDDHWSKALFESPIIGTSIYNMLSSKYLIRKFLKENVYDYSNIINNKDIELYNYFSHVGGIGNKYVISALMTKYLNIDIEKQIRNIDIPTKIVWGENNKLNSISNINIDDITLNKNITFDVFENTMMFPHLENTKIFNKICYKFFN